MKSPEFKKILLILLQITITLNNKCFMSINFKFTQLTRLCFMDITSYFIYNLWERADIVPLKPYKN